MPFEIEFSFSFESTIKPRWLVDDDDDDDVELCWLRLEYETILESFSGIIAATAIAFVAAFNNEDFGLLQYKKSICNNTIKKKTIIFLFNIFIFNSC